MDNRSLVLFLSGLAAASTAVCIAVSCSDQPRPKCVTGRGHFAAVYTPVSGDTMGACALPGETIGVQAYNYPNADRTNADLNRGSMAIQGSLVADAIGAHPDPDPDPTHQPSATGDWTTPEPGADDFCNVAPMKPGQTNLPYIPAVPPMPIPDAGPDAFTDEVPAVPGQDIKYEWSNVRVLVKSTANGTQLAGDLKLTTNTITDPDAGAVPCTATYKVRALFNPNQVHCEKVTDPDAGTTAPDFCQCLPYADPDNGRAVGSGLSPDLFGPQPGPSAACELNDQNAAALEAQSKVTCNPDLRLCVLKNDPPQ